jgi:Arsenical resistance operon protein ArsD
MKTLQVYDRPMCCSSGVCGVEADRDLICFALSLQWLGMNGVRTERFNPLHQYDAFAANATVTKTVNEKGIECLPLILMDGKVVSSGRYPSKLELGGMADIARHEIDAEGQCFSDLLHSAR